jgi:hypothetical protein
VHEVQVASGHGDEIDVHGAPSGFGTVSRRPTPGLATSQMTPVGNGWQAVLAGGACRRCLQACGYSVVLQE